MYFYVIGSASNLVAVVVVVKATVAILDFKTSSAQMNVTSKARVNVLRHFTHSLLSPVNYFVIAAFFWLPPLF